MNNGTDEINKITAAFLKEKAARKDYNEQQWSQLVGFYNYGSGNDTDLNFFIIPNTNISKIYLKNDLEFMCNYLQIEFFDDSFKFAKNIKINNTILVIQMIQNIQKAVPTSTEKTSPICYKGFFDVNDVNIESAKDSKIKYKLICSSVNLHYLLKNIFNSTLKPNIPTKTEVPLSPLKIIESMLNTVQQSEFSDVIPYFPKTTPLFDNNFKDTNRRIHFFTYQNMNLKRAISYCLATAVDQKTPPYFYVHRLLDNIRMYR